MPSFDRCTIYNVINKYGTAAEERINKMEKKEQLYEGKAKKVFATDDPDLVIVSYKDDATAFNGLKKGTISGKGVINNKMTNYMFGLLEKAGVPTHLVKELNDRETLVKKVSIVPLEVIVRNVAAGSFSKKLGIEEGTKLLCPTLEFSYKNDDLGDPFINDYYALALGTLILADEIAPDTWRFWYSTTPEKLDKDRFRRDMGGVEDAYVEIMKRLMGK